MVSVVDAAKRELVKLLRSLALVYSVVFSLTRDSADADVLKCFKQVSRKAHPDKGGKLEHQKALQPGRHVGPRRIICDNETFLDCKPCRAFYKKKISF